MTTAVGMGGPPVLLYLLAGGDVAARNRADLITTYAIIGRAALGVLLVAGAIGAETVSRALVLAPAFLLAAFAGSGVFRHSGEALYRRVALYFLLAVGLGTLIACAPPAQAPHQLWRRPPA